MKLAGFLIITFLLLIPCWGKSQTLNFSGKEISLKDIFKIIKCQTGVLFFYDAALLQYAKRVTIEWKNVHLETALNEIFKDQPITWVLEEKIVTIIKRPPDSVVKTRGRSATLVNVLY